MLLTCTRAGKQLTDSLWCYTGREANLLDFISVMRAVHLSIALQHMRPERVSTAFVSLHPASTYFLGLCANKYMLRKE